MVERPQSKKSQLTQRLRDHTFDTSGYHKINTGARRDAESGRLISNNQASTSVKKK